MQRMVVFVSFAMGKRHPYPALLDQKKERINLHHSDTHVLYNSQALPVNVSIFFAKMIDPCLLTQKNQTWQPTAITEKEPLSSTITTAKESEI